MVIIMIVIFNHTVCIEEKKNMNGLTEKRLSSDSGIEGGGLCPPNNLCTQPAITKVGTDKTYFYHR